MEITCKVVCKGEVMKTYTAIETLKTTGEFRATIDFGKSEVDWNMVHKILNCGCHCVWVESDLNSYVTIYGRERKCVQDRLHSLDMIVDQSHK